MDKLPIKDFLMILGFTKSGSNTYSLKNGDDPFTVIVDLSNNYHIMTIGDLSKPYETESFIVKSNEEIYKSLKNWSDSIHKRLSC